MGVAPPTTATTWTPNEEAAYTKAYTNSSCGVVTCDAIITYDVHVAYTLYDTRCQATRGWVCRGRGGTRRSPVASRVTTSPHVHTPLFSHVERHRPRVCPAISLFARFARFWEASRGQQGGRLRSCDSVVGSTPAPGISPTAALAEARRFRLG